jgi:hypothetical protein
MDYDFCLLFSSNASRFGGAGRAAYAAANAALEAFAENQWQHGDNRWLAVTWDGWRLEGEQPRSQSSPLDRFALSGSEASTLVELVVTRAHGAVTVVSKADVRERHLQWVRNVVADDTPEPVAATVEPTNERPAFGSELESEIAGLWRDVLGIFPTGPDERFFAIGGHSLMGLRLVSRIKDRFNVPFEYTTLVENDTVGSAARWIAARPDQTAAEPRTANRPSRTLSELVKLVEEPPT